MKIWNLKIMDMDENEMKELAEEIYGGDKYDGEIAKEDLEHMRDVFMSFLEDIKGKDDNHSTIEKIVIENNIKLIDTEMTRREQLNRRGKECEGLKTTTVEKV